MTFQAIFWIVVAIGAFVFVPILMISSICAAKGASGAGAAARSLRASAPQ